MMEGSYKNLERQITHLFSFFFLAAPFQWAAVFHKTDFAFDDLNPEHIRFYKSRNEGEFPSGKPALPCKISCSRCGSFLFDEGRNMVMLFPTSIRFDKTEDMDKFKVE